MAYNPAQHPRDARGRWRPTVVPGSVIRNTRVGKGGDYYGVKTGAEIALGRSGRRVLVKAIVGYRPKPKPATGKGAGRPAPRRYYAPGGRTYTTRAAR